MSAVAFIVIVGCDFSVERVDIRHLPFVGVGGELNMSGVDSGIHDVHIHSNAMICGGIVSVER